MSPFPGTPGGLQVFAAGEACLKCIKFVQKLSREYRHADETINSYLLEIDNHLLRLKYQAQALDVLWTQLDPEMREHSIRTQHELSRRAEHAVALINSIVDRPLEDKGAVQNSQVRRLQYIARVRPILKASMKELRQVRNVFDPSWLHVLLTTRAVYGLQSDELQQRLVPDIPTPASEGTAFSQLAVLADARLQAQSPDDDDPTPVFVPDLVDAVRDDIAFCHVQVAHLAENPAKRVLVDGRPCSDHYSIEARHVQRLARQFRNADPKAFGLLACRGVHQKRDDKDRAMRYEFYFDIPPAFATKQPQSLRSILQNRPRHGLEEKVRLGQQLARSVSFVHMYDFVHKNIRPENIIVLNDNDKPDALGLPVLLGLGLFRAADGATHRVGDDDWAKNLYRHPQRQGMDPRERYNMRHDIYSLGVCLLEIGLWEPLVTFKGQEPCPSHWIEVVYAEAAPHAPRAGDLSDMLVRLAKKNLAERMGSTYRNVVVSCLTCLDEDNEDFADIDDFQDEDGILIGARYIEKVMVQLNDIRV